MEAKPKVLILYTGGTIGMIKDAVSAQLTNVDFNHIYDHVPELSRINADLETVSFEHPIDSSEIQVKDWISIASTIFENYSQYDGFVVLHGSDTMAYTASALSFMFDGLRKPIILTGSQLPIGIIRTDGKENLITAIEIAAAKDQDGQAIVQEVAVYFEYKLFRGNRSTKYSAENFEAFKSPNYPELAEAGVNIRYQTDYLYRTSQAELSLNTDINDRVVLMKLYPGMNFALYESLFNRKQVDGIVLETFGAGNAPQSPYFKQQLKQFVDNGGWVVNITQCSTGEVKQGLYETSSMFNEVGVISGRDSTTEAAVTKMMTQLNRGNPATLLSQNLRGEVSED